MTNTMKNFITEEATAFLERYAGIFYMAYKGYYEKQYKTMQEYYRTCGYKNIKERNALAKEKAKATAKALTESNAKAMAYEANVGMELTTKDVWEILVRQYPEMA